MTLGVLRPSHIRLALPLVIGFFWPVTALTQSVAGVFSPVVNEGHISAEYRLGFVPKGDRAVHRLHYQCAVNDSVLWRVSAQGRHASGASFYLDHLGVELTWQITNNAAPWQSGIRIDARYNNRHENGSFAVNWANQVQLSDGVYLRFIGQGALDIGNGRRKGVLLQTRARIDWAASTVTTLGIESYNTYGSTVEIPALKDQVHQTGPFISARLGREWSVYGILLVGVTAASPDEEIRVRLGRRF